MSRGPGSAGRGGWRAAAALSAAIAVLAGCGSASTSTGPDHPEREASRASAVERYLGRVEPIRLGVNRLLDRAEPILRRYRRHRLGGRAAQRRMRRLERRFARYTARIRRLRPVPVELARAQRAYAHTYVLEDAYLRALTTAIPTRGYADLPRTQAAQRAAIVAWRTRLEALADRLDMRLPADVQLAGRGEIAPSPGG